MDNTFKQVPYGVADFETVMTQSLYFVDKCEWRRCKTF